ncbi:MAG: methionyl-tRNA formyltransferase [Pseudomonadota bacterium]
MTLRVIFMGTPDFSVPTLKALHGAGHELVAVYTQPPRAGGRRGLEQVPSPVHKAADELGLPIRTPLNFKKEEDREALNALNADVAVVVAYGLLLPQAVLDALRLGCLNGHGSKLPRWRGAAPIQRAIMAGDENTAIQIMKMEAGLDTGPVALSHEIAIGPNMVAGELHDEMSVACAGLMVEALAIMEAGALHFTPQAQDGVTYARKIEKSETRINWHQPTADVHNHIRGLSPFPGAWCEMEISGKPQRVKVLRCELTDGSGEPGTVLDDALTIACAQGAVRLVEIQRAGKSAGQAAEFLRGTPIAAGTKLASA